MNVLQRVASLRAVRDLSVEDARRMEADWNFVFTRLGITQGQLKTRRKELLNRGLLAHALRQLFGRKAAAI
jgi:hypothetical protein